MDSEAHINLLNGALIPFGAKNLNDEYTFQHGNTPFHRVKKRQNC